MAKRRKSKKSANAHGLNPKTFPVSVREYVEVDYLPQLNAKELAWLSRFNDQFHGADYRGDRTASTRRKQEDYRRKNAANSDVYSAARLQNRLAGIVAVPNPRYNSRGEITVDHPRLATPAYDSGALPSYLDTREYRDALAAYRELLPRNPRNKTRDSPQLRAALARLRRATGVRNPYER